MIDHSGEKPFYCKQCNYYFKSATDMMAHMIDHSGEKPLNCKKKAIFKCNYSSKVGECCGKGVDGDGGGGVWRDD